MEQGKANEKDEKEAERMKAIFEKHFANAVDNVFAEIGIDPSPAVKGGAQRDLALMTFLVALETAVKNGANLDYMKKQTSLVIDKAKVLR